MYSLLYMQLVVQAATNKIKRLNEHYVNEYFLTLIDSPDLLKVYHVSRDVFYESTDIYRFFNRVHTVSKV